MKRWISCVSVMLIVWSSWPHLGHGEETASQSAQSIEFFEKKVRPLLVGKCYNCHSADNKADGGLRVDDHRGMLEGGKRGPAVVPGDVEKSLLLKAVSYTDEKLKMPPEFKLADEEIAILTQWIAEGAVWPALEIPANLLKDDSEYDVLRREHWAWQPLTNPTRPTVQDQNWARDEIDLFIQQGLDRAGLAPVADADRATLLRRVTFDLTGLPPTSEELNVFLADASPLAFETVVDRLLSSPAFGERWGRHWLDVARFGESTGSARNLPYPHAWRYRDYVIDAFNQDKPFNQFVVEQIAGDLLPFRDDDQRQEQIVATGFLAIGVKDVNQRFKVRFTMDNIDEQIDTLSQAFLGLTVSCARCHDHKFDPISTKEYYGLAGIFHSTDLCAGVRNKMGGGGLDYYDPAMLVLLTGTLQQGPEYEARLAAAKQASEEAKKEFERLRDSEEGKQLAPNGRPMRQVARQKWKRLEQEYTLLTDPVSSGKAAMGLRDAKMIGDTEVRIRGEAEKLGPSVPRGFLKVVEYIGQPEIPTDRSGRLELAQWISSPQNPLVSRVIVNRIWHHLFGDGIVRSVDNFGVTGETPSHPELLDHLAQRFINDGWSIKRFIRHLVMTRSYQLGAEATPQHLSLDPANRLLWRHSPRRLAAEEIRDAMLLAANGLDPQRPMGSPAAQLPVIEIGNDGPESKRLTQAAEQSRLRSVYLPLVRTIVPGILEAFDFADQGLVTGHRDATTVPTQSLFLLNDPFVGRSALTVAENLLQQQVDDRVRVEQAYALVLARTPTSLEVEQAFVFLKDYEALAKEALHAEFAAIAQQEQQLAKATEIGASSTGQATDAGASSPMPEGSDPVDAARPLDRARPRTPQAAAWASFVQALFASGEFRYVR